MIDSSLSEENIYYLFAHNDDEFGVYPELEKQITKKKDRVFIVYLTTPIDDEIASIRENESLSVFSKMGLANDQIISLGRENNIPDGSLDSFLENALEAILELMEENGRPNRLYTHAWEGGNRDHDAANILAVAIAKRFGIMTNSYQFSLYLNDGLPFIFYKFFSPLFSNGEVISYKVPWKKRLTYFSYMLSYRSQLIPIIGLFPFYFFHFIFIGTQNLQKISDKRILEKPHSGNLLYEKRRKGSYLDFRYKINDFIEKEIFKS